MNEEYLKDIKDIKDIMNRSSRFISLSGWSGVSAGLSACIGGYLAYESVLNNLTLSYEQLVLSPKSFTDLILIAGGTLVVALLTSMLFTTLETKKANNKVWDSQTKRLVINLAIPLVTGGLICLMLLLQGYLSFAIPLSLVFYGLSLFHASKYTLGEVRSLGLIQMALGLISFQYLEYSFYFWVLGFGIITIGYGVIMQLRKP